MINVFIYIILFIIGGAWFSGVVDKSGYYNLKPVANIVCNSNKHDPVLTLNDVETLFHEAGHMFQHILTKIDIAECSGINSIEWDSVEIPSQGLESLYLIDDVMKNISNHRDTNEKMPKDLYNKIKNSKHHLAGTMLLRQLYFINLDLKLHEMNYNDNINISDYIKNIQNECDENFSVLKPLDEDLFLNSFLHIFAGGYSAGYYSYLYAEIFAAEIYTDFENAFKTNDMNNVKQVAKKFKDTILSLGGSESPKDVFIKYKGREPKIDALIKQRFGE